MKKILGILLLVFLVFSIAGIANAASRTRGYIKKNGTYVQPYYRSTPNKTKWDNWSTKGNYNPYTGKKGSASPFKSYKIKRYR